MSVSLAYFMILGIPLVIWLGIVTFLCLITTVTPGILVVKGSYHLPFKWHMRMAAITIFFVTIHVFLVIVRKSGNVRYRFSYPDFYAP